MNNHLKQKIVKPPIISEGMNKENLVIIFARNPVLGKVKTKLAREIGDEGALQVYLKLLEHTHKVADEVAADKQVYYTDSLDEFGLLDYFKFTKKLQDGEDLGERMHNAMKSGFDDGYRRVLIIGSDCMELSAEVIEEAFVSLTSSDCVMGPATDGGYYLIGLRVMQDFLFQDKPWGSSDVLLDTLLDLQNAGMSYHLLPTLNDIDSKKDLDRLPNLMAE